MKVTDLTPARGCTITVISAEKNAIIDVGLLSCANQSIGLVKEVLNGSELDYIILSHSHYDHIGALSMFRDAFPEAKVIGSPVCGEVLNRPGALEVMKKLSEDAVSLYCEDEIKPVFDTKGFYLDIVVDEGDVIDLGDTKLDVYKTPGHTNCSLTFYDAENGVMYISEALGAMCQSYYTNMTFLKSYNDCVESVKRMAALEPKELHIPHWGKYEGEKTSDYFDLAIKDIILMKDMIGSQAALGKNDDEIAEYMVENCYKPLVTERNQVVTAFLANIYPMIKVLHKEYPELWSK